MSRLLRTQFPFSDSSLESVGMADTPPAVPPRGHIVSAETPARVSTAWRDRLTPREREILDRLARGLLYREIGAELGIRTPTVKNHLHRIYAKLGARSRTEAVVRWLGSQGAATPVSQAAGRPGLPPPAARVA